MRVLIKAITGNDVAQVRALLQEGVDINQRYLADYPLEAAIRTGSLELVQAFLESGVDVNFVYGEPEQRNRETALTFAVQGNQPALCQFLLTRGADPNYLQTDE
ncbi:MAG: ankyrin repeat domain-containing protein [Anaerolineae bacterium]|nr:ankyrin repeat domain-containing protein [Anaerolineae bacterium]